MEPRILVQGPPCELCPDTEPPNLYPPPLSRGSGVVVESPLLDPLLLCQAVREQLDVHVQRKRRQLLWGLPHIIQSSLERSWPALPGFLVCTALQETNGHQRPLFKAERRQCLERHLREKTMHHKWGLPWRIQKSLLWPLPPGPAPSPHCGCSPKRGSATAARTWDRGVKGIKKAPRRGSATELAEETLSLDLASPHPPMPGEQQQQQEALLVPDMGGPGGGCPQSGLDPPWLTALVASAEPALLDGVLDITREPRSRLDFQGWDRQQPNRPKPGLSEDTAASAGSFSLARATHLEAKLADSTKKPFPLSESLPQGSSNLTGSQDLRPQEASCAGASRLQPIVRSEKNTIVSQENPCPVATLLPGKRALGQAPPSIELERGQTLSVQTHQAPAASQAPVHQDSSFGLLAGTSLSGIQPCQEAHWKPCLRSLLGNTAPCWGPSPARARQGPVPTPEKRVNSQARSSQATHISVISSEGSQGVTSLPASDQKQYFEFHLREKLLHQRWGLPKRVQESLARSAMLKAARP